MMLLLQQALKFSGENEHLFEFQFLGVMKIYFDINF